MKELIKKYWWIAAIGLVVIAAVAALSSKKEGQPLVDKEIEPTPTKTEERFIPGDASGVGPNPIGGASKEVIEKQEKVLDNNKSMYPLAGELPYQTVYYTINHYVKPLRLAVYIKREEDKEMVEQMVEKWLEEKGFKANSHEIEWRVGNP